MSKAVSLSEFEDAANELEAELYTLATLAAEQSGKGPVGVFITPKGEPKAMPITFDKMQKEIGGWIQAVRLPSGNILMVDEEGLRKGLPVSPTTFIARQKIVGPVFFIPKKYKRRFT